MKKITLLFSLITFSIINAQNIVQDDLTAYTTGLQLSGQGVWTNNSSLPGGAGLATAGGTNAKVIAFPISYQDYGTSINAMDIKPNSDGCGFPFTAVTSGDLFVGFVLNMSLAQANNNSDFFRILSGGNFNTSARLYAITNTPFDFNIGVAKGANGNPIALTSSALSLETNHLIIIKYTQLPGNNDDTVSVYIDPIFSNGVPTNPTMVATAGLDQSGSLDRLNVRQNWTNGMPTGKLGLVSVSTTWAGLGFIPLSTSSFDKPAFVINSSSAKDGILSIETKIALNNAKLTIYDLQGRSIENKTISLQENNNEISINPIQNIGVYIVEIVSENKKTAQKIIIN